MKHEFIYKLDIRNLLWLHEEIQQALADKDPNDILDYLKKLEVQKKNVKNNKEYDSVNKQIALLDSIANFNCA
jgi:ABC-type hemin transport system substrate-binding protein